MKKTGMLMAGLLLCFGGLHAETKVEGEGEEAKAPAKIGGLRGGAFAHAQCGAHEAGKASSG